MKIRWLTPCHDRQKACSVYEVQLLLSYRTKNYVTSMNYQVPYTVQKRKSVRPTMKNMMNMHEILIPKVLNNFVWVRINTVLNTTDYQIVPEQRMSHKLQVYQNHKLRFKNNAHNHHDYRITPHMEAQPRTSNHFGRQPQMDHPLGYSLKQTTSLHY